MRVTWSRIAIPALVLAVVFATAAVAGVAPGTGNLKTNMKLGPLADVPEGPGMNWIDHFDTYSTGMQLHGVGGWEGWANSVANGALTSSTQARTAPNSVEITGASDLTHPETGFTSGTWTYTAWQYIPSGLSGTTYFIMLNTYSNDAGCTGCNWSVQVNFDSITGLVANDGTSGGTAPIVFDQWVPIVVVINLDSNTQQFWYNGSQLYAGTWTEEVSGGGALNIGTVDLFANGATPVYYDDNSLSNMPFTDDFETGDVYNWHFYVQ